MKNRTSPLWGILGAFAIGMIILMLAYTLAGFITALLWNLVMPFLGLPQLTTFQGIVLYALVRTLTQGISITRKQPSIKIMNISNNGKETNSESRNSYNA